MTVVRLPNADVSSGRDPIPEIVEHCEALLEAAQQGRVRALVTARVEVDAHPEPIYGHFWLAPSHISDLTLVAGLVVRRLERALDDISGCL